VKKAMKRFCFLILTILISAPAFAANVTGVWANNGEDKVTQDELRAAQGTAGTNTVWDGTQISVFGGRNETVSFNAVLEASGNAASNVTVSFNKLTGPGGAAIASAQTSGNGVFDWTQRPIELFFVRYLQIKGLSLLSYETYDERHVPRRLRKQSGGGWTSRPDHDKYYPDIAVPMELTPSFSIASKSNQSVWADIYIPKGAAPGVYQGVFEVREGGAVVKSVPVKLQVYDFTLPDVPSAKTMLYYSATNINRRYLGNTYVDPNSSAGARAKSIRDRHFMLAHRHRFALIGDSPEDCGSGDSPCPEWEPRLNGSLFTAANGYDGPGVNKGNDVYSIGTYGNWGWKSEGQAGMQTHTDAWENWFTQHAPNVERFLYLIDESADTAQIQTWCNWVLNNPGPGRNLRTLATIGLPSAASGAPGLDIPTSAPDASIASVWQPLVDRYTSDARKRFYMYNGKRPYTGSTATEDDGVALRERAWAQYKLKANRWYFWETTYYNDFQGGTGEGNLFRTAHTFGGFSTVDSVKGETGWNYSNGDGVLFYPGTDKLYASDSYGVDGPFASLRLKYWRRGLQDVDYLTMAAAINPTAVQQLVNAMVPKAAWEYGVTSTADPTYVLTDISWTDDPRAWENARAQLAAIIAGSSSGGSSTSGPGAPAFVPPPLVAVDGQLTATPTTSEPLATFNWTITPAAAGAPVKVNTPSGTLSLGPLALPVGDYQVSVTVTDTDGNVSAATTRSLSLASQVYPARVYPNPWRADRNAGMPVTFEQPVLKFTVTIMSGFSGRRVKTVTASEGRAVWDLTNDSGSPVSSGTYIYVVKSSAGQIARGRVAVIR
jgi:hypothetical protein